MRNLFVIASLMVLFWGCSNGQSLMIEQTPLLKITNPYWQKIFPGQPEGKKRITLVLPYETPVLAYTVDSVYFKGYFVEMRRAAFDGTEVYRADMIIDDGSDTIQPPVNLSDNEALVTFWENDKRKYFLVESIEEKEPLFLP